MLARSSSAAWAMAALIGFVAVSSPSDARAAERAEYETGRFQRALDEHGWTVDAAPEGKRIRTVHIVRRDVLAEDEIIPTFFNAFHWLSREDVVRQELLFAEGEVWDGERVDETARNLRGMTTFAIVRIAPLQTEEAGVVDVLVFTRDLWSLRLETSFQVTDALVDELGLTLIERNLFGRAKRAALLFHLLPKTWSLGELYHDRRVLGGNVALTQTFNVVFRREDSTPEGTSGSLEVGIPLYDLARRWGFEAAVGYHVLVGRQLSGRELLTYDNPDTPALEEVSRIWNDRVITARLAARHQIGTALKHRFTFGMAASDAKRSLHSAAGAVSPQTRDAFHRDVLGPSRRQIYPYLSYTMFQPTWAGFSDLAAFGLSEDVRIGPQLSALVGLPLEAFGSSSDSLFYELIVGWTFAPGGGLIDLRATTAARVEASELIDREITARVRGATPIIGFGRLVGYVAWEGRVDDTRNSLVTLGGDSGLRGYGSQALFGFGANRLRVNVELRTLPLIWQSLHVGGLVFYDAGDVYTAVADFHWRHSAGLGIRFLLPQFNRNTFRVDFGVPLDSDGFQVLVTFGSAQTVPLTALEDLRNAE